MASVSFSKQWVLVLLMIYTIFSSATELFATQYFLIRSSKIKFQLVFLLLHILANNDSN